MRCSVILALIAVAEHVVYGFSQQQQPSSLSPWRQGCVVTPAATPSSSVSPACCRYNNPRVHPSLAVMAPRGGGKLDASASSSDESSSSSPGSGGLAGILASLWGTTGVLYILAKAIKRVIPIALEPFQGGAALSQFELGAYIVTCLWFAYVEGYKGFQQKFSPLVVKRSFTLVPGKNGTSWFHFLLAPLYSMGLMHATKKRQIVSWSVTIGVAGIVAAVKRLPYPWRNIIDAGVVVGLTWGSLSIVLNYVKSWVTGKPPSQVGTELPASVVEKE